MSLSSYQSRCSLLLIAAGLVMIRARRKRTGKQTPTAAKSSHWGFGGTKSENSMTNWQRKKNSNAEKKRKLQLEVRSRNSSATEDALKLWRIEESSSEFTLYDFPELAAATGGFSDENLLGRGGFGPVYKASRCLIIPGSIMLDR